MPILPNEVDMIVGLTKQLNSYKAEALYLRRINNEVIELLGDMADAIEKKYLSKDIPGAIQKVIDKLEGK